MGEIYRLDFVSGKSYVGMTRGNARNRFKEHVKAVRHPKLKKSALYGAWRKYGAPTMLVLVVVPNDELAAEEVRWIAELGTQSPFGYNITPGGEESPALVPEVARRISVTRTGMKFSDEHRQNLSIAHIGIPSFNKGKLLPAYQVKALRAGHARYLLTPETDEIRAKKAAGGRHPLSLEGRAKVSAARKAYWARRRAAQAVADGI